MTRRAAWALALVALTTTLAAAQAGPLRDPSAYVRVMGEHFWLHGSVFRFVGANVAVMHGTAHRAALETTLDAVHADGLAVIRVWALGERDAEAPEWAQSYAFRVGEEGWVEPSFDHLDRVLAAARARDLRVIVVLANRWADYGGIPQYLRWSGDAFDASPSDGIPRAELGTFFRSSRAQALYLSHVERVVGRTSSLTGIAYRDDPTILGWELVNEISAERRDAPALAAFVSSTARRVHALDPNHLVSAGHIGYVTSAERRTWREIETLPEIDFADAHAYPTEHDRTRTLADLDAFVDDHAMLAHSLLHRPLVLGEVGFAEGATFSGRDRASLFDRFLSRAERAGVDGALAWIYAPSTERAGAQTIVTDAPDASSEAVRRVLHVQAQRFASTLAMPSWPSSDARLWDPSHVITGTRHIARARDGTVRWSPDAFSEARFETVGRYDGFAIAQIYGGGAGTIAYRFRAPRTTARTLRVSMRASSELPGRGEGRTVSDGSRVLVSIDGQRLGVIEVPPDDAIGRVVSLEVPVDAALAPVLRESRVHTLRFDVADDDDAHGLCLYGGTTGAEAVDPTVAAELPGVIELAFLP